LRRGVCAGPIDVQVKLPAFARQRRKIVWEVDKKLLEEREKAKTDE